MPKQRWYPKRPDIKTEEIIRLKNLGYSPYKIGPMLGLSVAGIYTRLWKHSQPEKAKETWQEITRRRMLSAAKKRAREAGLPFTLKLEDITVPDRCPIFGYEFSLGVGTLNDGSPTLDKIIPALGYVPRNIWVISWKANRAKSNLSVEELAALVAAVSRKQKEILCQ